MIGSKPLDEKEIKLMLGEMRCLRDQCLLVVGVRTGFRISELLSLTVESVMQYGEIRDSVTVSRSNMKGKINSRTVVLHNEAKAILKEYLSQKRLQNCDKLFPISRVQAGRIIKGSAKRARVGGKVTSHSCRKTFAKKVYEALDRDLVSTQKALGHKSINSTVSYLSFDQGEIDNAILGV